jgi:hypothetical protein
MGAEPCDRRTFALGCLDVEAAPATREHERGAGARVAAPARARRHDDTTTRRHDDTTTPESQSTTHA